MKRLILLFSLLALIQFARPNYAISRETAVRINTNFQLISDNTQLFNNNSLNELYSVVKNTPGINSGWYIAISKVNYLPSLIMVNESSKKGSHPFLWIIIPLVLVLLIVLVVFFFVLKRARDRELKELERARKELKKETAKKSEDVTPIDIPEALVAEIETNGSPVSEHTINFVRPQANALWLLGKFAIFDKKGMNIIHLCSGQTRSLFFMVLLSTLYADGISSEELSDVLWSGMDKTHAKNNRSVTMNHLRKIFEEMEGIALIYEKRKWKISFDDNIYIDLVDLYRKRENKQGNAKAIIDIYSLGSLLHDEKVPMLDKYKRTYRSEAIEFLNTFGNECFEKQAYDLCHEIANIIHNHFDELNENALQLKLTALTRLRNYNRARQEYDSFSQRFKQMMEVEFPIPFNKLAGIE